LFPWVGWPKTECCFGVQGLKLKKVQGLTTKKTLSWTPDWGHRCLRKAALLWRKPLICNVAAVLSSPRSGDLFKQISHAPSCPEECISVDTGTCPSHCWFCLLRSRLVSIVVAGHAWVLQHGNYTWASDFHLTCMRAALCVASWP